MQESMWEDKQERTQLNKEEPQHIKEQESPQETRKQEGTCMYKNEQDSEQESKWEIKKKSRKKVLRESNQ